AVDDLSFSLNTDEIFGFLGPNGSGKTTTINMLTGLARPTSGHIYFDGMDYSANIKKAQQFIGIVPDESNLYDELDGLDNLCFCASLYGIKKVERQERARILLREFDLLEAGKKLFKTYSKGMKRKLTIAAAIIHRPTMLFLDEPTTGIDVANARRIRALLKSLNAAGTTIFLTTHYIEEAERLCHRIAFIVDGRIVTIGSVQELMQEAQKEKIIQFSFADSVELDQLEPDFSRQFLDCRLERMRPSAVQLRSSQALDLMPFMSFFAGRGIKVLEAKIIQPSLEEVFVKLTGIEREVMRREKEGKKK
ncbi:ABC transporter ATP-binding protein, partial [candidate division KSB1 bacterium]|nr:ABC transporter ATP-binding protein [candidate division KSB1 bacterium]